MLKERETDFAYGYRMTCGVCKTKNWLTAEQHHAARLQDEVPCSKGHNFKFGHRVIALRDPRDLALDDDMLPQLAWYHTTTVPNWPARSRLLTENDIRQFERANWTEDQIEREKTKTLHIGTYEAALESMLRNMDQRDHQHSTFYLHRIRLRRAVVIEKGFRDENNKPAANITTADLPQGKDGIRYLNAHESMGSISLAITRGAIESTQRLALPVPGLGGKPSEATVNRVSAFREKVQELCEAHDRPAKGAKTIALRLAALKGEQSPVQPVDSAETSEPIEAHEVLTEMNNFVGDQYLKGISPVIRENFLERLHRPQPSDDHALDLVWLSRFTGLAALFTRPCEVLRKLDDQQWQDIQPA